MSTDYFSNEYPNIRDEYEEDFFDDEEEYTEFLDKCERKYAEDYAKENPKEFEEYLIYSGYTLDEFMDEWTDREKKGAYIDFLHEAEDREEYIRQKEGLI